MTAVNFSSWLAPRFEAFVSLRRATGAQYVSGERLLLRFDRYLVEHAVQPPLTADDLLSHLGAGHFRNPRSRDNVVSVVWPALEHARRHGADVRALPPRPRAADPKTRLTAPRILTDPQIVGLLDATRQLGLPGRLRPATAATLFGLMLCTGLRIGEALALDVGDVDGAVLTVRRGKYGKQRVLPLRPSTATALGRYVDDPRRPISSGPGQPLFVSGRRRRLADQTARGCLTAAAEHAGMSALERPRPHDLRHTFTVRRVAAWYAAGADVNRMLPALSTYLGHVSVEHTRVYLTTNAMLVEHARRRFEAANPALWRRNS